MPHPLRLTGFSCLMILGLVSGRAEAGDADALWKIVDGQCVAHERAGGDPSPCARVDLQPGAGFAVLKDHVGAAQFLLIPTLRISGIESPELLTSASPNYFAEAWKVTPLVQERLHRPLARDQLALAINSAFGRSQNQLHIHVDCLRPDIGAILRQHLGEIGSGWTPLDASLAGHSYWARRIPGAELGDNNPFKLLAEGLPGALQHMDQETLVVVGATFESGEMGFILLADHADLATLDRAHGEELQDHSCAAGPK